MHRRTGEADIVRRDNNITATDCVDRRSRGKEVRAERGCAFSGDAPRAVGPGDDPARAGRNRLHRRRNDAGHGQRDAALITCPILYPPRLHPGRSVLDRCGRNQSAWLLGFSGHRHGRRSGKDNSGNLMAHGTFSPIRDGITARCRRECHLARLNLTAGSQATTKKRPGGKFRPAFLFGFA